MISLSLAVEPAVPWDAARSTGAFWDKFLESGVFPHKNEQIALYTLSSKILMLLSVAGRRGQTIAGSYPDPMLHMQT